MLLPNEGGVAEIILEVLVLIGVVGEESVHVVVGGVVVAAEVVEEQADRPFSLRGQRSSGHYEVTTPLLGQPGQLLDHEAKRARPDILTWTGRERETLTDREIDREQDKRQTDRQR